MTPGPLDAIAPGAASQLAALLVTVAGGAVVAGLVWGVLRLRNRRPTAAAAAKAAAPVDWIAMVRRLLGAILLLALAVPTAVAVRQLWPHPDLGPRLGVAWLLILVPPTVVWLRGHNNNRGGRPRP